MSKIFLSHNSSDKPFVRKIAADLRKYGHTVWVDEAEINIGDSLIGKIREGLDSVDYVAVVLSESSLKSEWVQKEIEIASNREIEEKKVVVLPIIVEQVELPGFLKGKFYGDFTKSEEYQDKLQLLLRSLGTDQKIISEDEDELDSLRAELKEIKLIAERHKKELDQITNYSLRKKSKKLREAIEKENAQHPEYEPINNVYAFEIGKSEIPITLGYMQWVLAKIQREGSHQLEWVLEAENKWDEAIRMLEAYSDMINQ